MDRRWKAIVLAGLVAAGALALWSARRGARDVDPEVVPPPAGGAAAAPSTLPALARAGGTAVGSAAATTASPPPPAAPPPPTAAPPQAPAAGDVIHARLVGPDGRPLAGVAVARVRRWILQLPDLEQQFLARTGPEGAPEGTRPDERATTRDDGSFDLPGTPGDAPVDLVWVVDRAWAGGVLRIGLGERIVAVPAASLTGRVVDEAGAPVPGFSVRVAERHRGVEESVAATNGGFVVTWSRPPGTDAEVDATVLVSQPGFVPVTQDVKIPADRDAAEVTLTLRPAPESATLVVHVVGPPPRLASRPMEVELSPPHEPARVAERCAAAWRDAATLVATIPSGDWRVRVRVADGWAHLLAWDGTLALPAGRETEVTWTPAPCGSVRLRTRALGSIAFGPAAGGPVALRASGPPDEVVDHVPVGRWTAQRWPPDGAAPIVVEVTEGAEVVADLTR